VSHYFSRHASAGPSVENAKESVDRVQTVIDKGVNTLEVVLEYHALSIFKHKRVYMLVEVKPLVLQGSMGPTKVTLPTRR